MAGLILRTTVDGKLVKRGLQNLLAKIPRIGKLQIYNAMVRSRTKLKKPGKRPTYPIPWSSVRQKIKVIIILKHVLREMPYKRRGIYQKAFTIVAQKNGYDMVNESPRATFLGGDAEGKGQIRMARGRYPIIRKVIDDEVKKLPAAVVQHIQLAAREEGLNGD